MSTCSYSTLLGSNPFHLSLILTITTFTMALNLEKQLLFVSPLLPPPL